MHELISFENSFSFRSSYRIRRIQHLAKIEPDIENIRNVLLHALKIKLYAKEKNRKKLGL